MTSLNSVSDNTTKKYKNQNKLKASKIPTLVIRNQSLTTVQPHKHSNHMCISRLGRKNFLSKVSAM